MTTAEFIIGHSEDDAAERKKEARKILWALLAALAIHLLIGYGLAVFGGMLSTPFSVSEEEKPVELTFMDLATPAPTKNTMFVQNDESKQTEQPKEKTFESNANSIAASEQAAAGSMPLPSQDGSERTKLDFNSQAASLAQQGAQAQPSVAPQESATPQPSAQPTPMTKSEEFAMLTSRPTPRPTVASTPLGRYQKTLFDAIGSHWYAYIEQKADLVSLGTTRVSFWVDRSGRVKNLKVLSN